MTTIGDIFDKIDELAPFRNADSFDNSGLLVGSRCDEVTKVLLSLDATLDVADEAKEKGCQLVITHHPVLFNAIKKLDISHPAVRLIRYGIGCICAHTNLDSAEYNISDIMCELMGLKPNDGYFTVNRCDPETGAAVGYGRVADCEKIAPADLAKKAKEAFKCGFVRFVQGKDDITRVAFCSGAGGDFAYECLRHNAQAFITSDIKHHEFLDAYDMGLTVIDCGHFNTEVIVLPYIKEVLSKAFPNVEFMISETENSVIKAL
ncbi:MAG: Nif3-like dinuclear metal center hexameric protein [Oscillospiraceae bacterium]|nr:Nif3-like dinuclear metal center hexameric protein [Oscillospiraceae bacterium]